MAELALNPAASTTTHSFENAVFNRGKESLQCVGERTLDAASVMPTAVIDWAGRAADAVDWGMSLPKWIGDQAKHIPITGAGWLGSTLGSITSGVLQCAAHGLSFGAAKWLQWLRRSGAVNAAVESTIGDVRDEIGSISVKSYLATIQDRRLRQDLAEYFKQTVQLGKLDQTEGLSPEGRDAERELLQANLARLEVKLSRRAEFLEVKRLAGMEATLEADSRRMIESRADTMAALMIMKAENHYKDRLSVLGSKVSAEWDEEGAEVKREALRDRLRVLLLAAYEAEKNKQDASGYLAKVKSELGEAFLAKSTLRQAGFYAVLGVLMHTGALGAGLQWGFEKLGDAAGWAGNAVYDMVPAWMQQLLTNAGLYAKGVLAAAAGYFGIKTALDVKNSFGDHSDASRSPSDLDSRPADGAAHDAPRPQDGGTPHDDVRPQDSAKPPADADMRSAEPSVHDALKAEAEAQRVLADQNLHQADAAAAAARQSMDPTGRTGGDASARIDPQIGRAPHADLRAGELQGRVDPNIGKVHVRVTPR